MAYEPKDNSGALFINDRKETDTHPDRKGTALIGGVEYFVSGWLKTKDGKPWLSLAFQPKQQQSARSPSPSSANKPEEESIPF